jgi:hypothetical protein
LRPERFWFQCWIFPAAATIEAIPPARSKPVEKFRKTAQGLYFLSFYISMFSGPRKAVMIELQLSCRLPFFQAIFIPKQRSL